MSATILVIDDSDDDQLLYQLAFRDFGGSFNLLMASSAEAGFVSISLLKPDLILLDYNLPGMDGLSFMKKLHECSDALIPIIMLTGQGNAAVAVDAMKNGVDDYVVKDIEGRYLKMLPGLVGHVMAAHQQREKTQQLQKQTDALLRRNQILMQNALDGIRVTDIHGNIVEANDAFCRMLGYTQEEMSHLNEADWEANWTDYSLRERISELIGKNGQFETRHRCKDGSLIDVEISFSSMVIEGQHFFIAASRDISQRKQTEQALLKSEANLHAMLDNSPYLTWLKDAEGRYISINKVFAEYLRLDDCLHAIGKTDLELHPKALAEKYLADDAEVMRTRKQKYVEEMAFDEQNILWVETFKTPILDNQGKVLGTVGFARDITERKNAEQSLRESEANLKEMFENLRSGVAVYRVSADGNDFFINSFNKTAERIEKRSREDVTGKSVVEIFPRFVEFGLLDAFRRVWQSGVEEYFPLTRFKNDRITYWRDNFIYKLPNGEIVTIYDDVTLEKQAEEELLLESVAQRKNAEALAQQFGHLLQCSFNEIYMFDAKTLKFILTSEGAEQNLGYSDEELRQRTPLDLKPQFTRENFESLIAPLRIGKQQTLLFETSHLRKDGSTYPVEIRLQFMGGDNPVFLAIVQDITERSLAEKQMREFTAHLQTVREEEKANIAREVHDELGGTLAALKMDAYWLAGKLENKEEMKPLQDCAKNMVELLNTAVLSTRRIITDLRPTILDELGLAAALKWQCAEFQKRTGIRCRCICAENESLEKSLDKLQLINLFRIAQEALTNVARHSGASQVEVDLRQAAETIILTIYDDGKGLPKGHIISPTSYGMRGMRERVAQFGGKIKFDSLPAGGFGVIVKLPLLHGSVKSHANHANHDKYRHEK